MFIALKLETMLGWEHMLTHAGIASIVMMGLKCTVQMELLPPLMVLMSTAPSLEEDTPVSLLFMKGMHAYGLLNLRSS
jgi:hypothetical protein